MIPSDSGATDLLDIAFLSMDFDVGGLQRHTVGLADVLEHRYGFSVGHIGLSKQRASPLLGEVRRNVTYLDRRGLGAPGMLISLFAYLRRNPARLLVGVNPAPMTAVSLSRLCAIHGGRTAGILHTTVLRDNREELAQLIHTQAMRRLDRLIYVSGNQQHHWEGRGLRSTGSKVIRNGIDVEHFAGARSTWRKSTRERLGFADHEIVVGLCARFRREKNHGQLLQAIRLLRDGEMPVRALLVGSGPTEQACRAHAAELGLQSACVFAGEQIDVRPHLAAMDVGVLCSNAVETLSLSALEMMATGLPLVLSEIGGASEIVDEGVNGYLFPVGDTEKLISRLTAMTNQEERMRMGGQSLRIVKERFDIERMNFEYAALLSSLVRT